MNNLIQKKKDVQDCKLNLTFFGNVIWPNDNYITVTCALL